MGSIIESNCRSSVTVMYNMICFGLSAQLPSLFLVEKRIHLNVLGVSSRIVALAFPTFSESFHLFKSECEQLFDVQTCVCVWDLRSSSVLYLMNAELCNNIYLKAATFERLEKALPLIYMLANPFYRNSSRSWSTAPLNNSQSINKTYTGPSASRTY